MNKDRELMLQEYFGTGQPVPEELKKALEKKLAEAEIKRKKCILLAMASVPFLITVMLMVFVFFFGGITVGAVIIAGYFLISALFSVLFAAIASKYVLS